MADYLPADSFGESTEIQYIEPLVLKKKLQSKEADDFLIIDCRDYDFPGGNIPGKCFHKEKQITPIHEVDEHSKRV